MRSTLLVVSGIFPPELGGPAKYLATALPLLAQHFDLLGVYTQSPVRKVDDSAHPFKVWRLRRFRPRLARMLRAILAIARLARRADIVYGHGMMLETALAVRLLRRRRLVFKIVGDLIWEREIVSGRTALGFGEFQTARHGLRVKALRRLQAWYVGSADAVIVPSVHLARAVAGWGIDPQRIHVVYNSVDRADLQPTAKSFDVVSVGRLLGLKGFAPLIGLAVRRGWRLKIVGDGPERPHLEALVRECGAGPFVQLRGGVAQEQVPAEIASARVFVLNSIHEGLPHVVLEAHAAGTPVVATDVGGTGEAVAHECSGLLVPSGDEAALEGAIDRILEDPEFGARLAERGTASLATTFSKRHMIETTAQILMGPAACG